MQALSFFHKCTSTFWFSVCWQISLLFVNGFYSHLNFFFLCRRKSWSWFVLSFWSWYWFQLWVECLACNKVYCLLHLTQLLMTLSATSHAGKQNICESFLPISVGCWSVTVSSLKVPWYTGSAIPHFWMFVITIWM